MNELENLLEAYKNAVFQKDPEAFLALFDEDVRVFDMWERWGYDGLPAWREMVKGWFSSLGENRDRVGFEDVEFQWSGDLATVTAFVRFAAVSPRDEELRFLYNRLTLIVRKKTDGPGGWKIIHQHTSAPVDGTLKAKLSK